MQSLIQAVKMLSFRYRMQIGITILFVALAFSHSLFFFSLPLPGFSNDFISYLEVVEKMKFTHLPVSDWVPLGYPVFIWMISLFSDSIFTVVIIQCLLSLCSGIFLLATINKYFPSITVFSALGLGIFFLSVNTVDFNTTLLTESLYVSCSFFACALTLHALGNPSKPLAWMLVAASYLLLMQIRPAGLVFFGYLPVFLLYFAIIKAPAKNYLLFTGTWAVLVLLWMSYNYLTLGFFNIGYPAQFSHGTLEKKEFQLQYDESLEVPQGRLDNFWRYYRNFSDQRTFYSVLADRHQRMYDSTNAYLYLGFHEKYKDDCFTFLPGINIDSMVYKEYYPKPARLDKDFYNLSESRFFRLYDFFYIKLGNPLFKNALWVVLFFLSGIFGTFSFFFDKEKRKISSALLFIFSLNLSAGLLFLISQSMIPTVRYSYPMQFCYYLIMPFTFLLAKKYFAHKNPRQ